MTVKEAKQLLIGTVVMWMGDSSDLGTVRKLSSTGFYVVWTNGQQGWVDYHGAEKVSTH